MKTTLIALAAVIGLSGAAYAKDDADKATPRPVATQTDTLTTGSIKQDDASAPTKGEFASKKGIDVNPNFLPIF